jgi:hypothetical protein
VRYADDCNVYVHSQPAGERVMESLERFLAKRLRLKVNRTKSAVAKPEDRKFLGYTITRQGGQPRLKVAPKAVQRLKAKLKPLFRQGRGMKLATTIVRLNRITRGWIAYFRLSWDTSGIRAIDSWIRRHLRVIQWRQWKKPSTRYRKLIALGLPAAQARCALNRCGAWPNAKLPCMHFALSTTTLANMGLVSLLHEHQRLACSS